MISVYNVFLLIVLARETETMGNVNLNCNNK